MTSDSRANGAFYQQATQQPWSAHTLPPIHHQIQNSSALLNTLSSRTPPDRGIHAELGSFAQFHTPPFETHGESFAPQVHPTFEPASEVSWSPPKADHSYGAGRAPNEATARTLLGADRFGTLGGGGGLRTIDRMEQHFRPLVAIPASRAYCPQKGDHQHLIPPLDEESITTISAHTGEKAPAPPFGHLNTLREEVSPFSVSSVLKLKRPSALNGENCPVGPGPTTSTPRNGECSNSSVAPFLKSSDAAAASAQSFKGLPQSPTKSSQKQLAGYPKPPKPNLKYTPSLAALLSNVVASSPTQSPLSDGCIVPNGSSSASLDGVFRADSAACLIPASLSFSILASEHLVPDVQIVSLLEPWPATLAARTIAIPSSAAARSQYGRHSRRTWTPRRWTASSASFSRTATTRSTAARTSTTIWPSRLSSASWRSTTMPSSVHTFVSIHISILNMRTDRSSLRKLESCVRFQTCRARRRRLRGRRPDVRVGWQLVRRGTGRPRRRRGPRALQTLLARHRALLRAARALLPAFEQQHQQRLHAESVDVIRVIGAARDVQTRAGPGRTRGRERRGVRRRRGHSLRGSLAPALLLSRRQQRGPLADRSVRAQRGLRAHRGRSERCRVLVGRAHVERHASGGTRTTASTWNMLQNSEHGEF